MTATSTQHPVRGLVRHRRAPCVVFVDDSRWAAFHQLSPLLRRAGVRTIRVCVGGRTGSRIASRLVYDRCEVLRDGADTAGLRAILADEQVIDVQYVEALGELVRSGLELLDHTVAARVRQRLAIQDKLFAAELFAAAGVRTPAVVPVGAASPEEIAALFGFPVVVKDRAGSAGANVVIAGDLDTLAATVDSPDAAGVRRYYEQFVDGDKLNYAAAVSEAGCAQELAYRVIRWRMPAGTASEVQTIADRQLVAIGRHAVEVAGCTGLMNMDVIRDHDGRDWLIDFNARAFGGAVCFQSADIDLSEGYLQALGQRCAPVGRATAVAGVRFPVFPTCLGAVIERGSTRQIATAFLREARPYRRWIGARYWLSEALSIADSARTSRRARRCDAPPPPPVPARVRARTGAAQADDTR